MKNSKSSTSITAIPTHLAPGRFSRFDDADPVIKDIVAAQGRARGVLQKILEVHELRMSNLMEAPLANLRASKAHAEKELAATLPIVDGQRTKTRAAIAELQKEIDGSLAQGASWQFAKETREHVRSLPNDKREAFVSDALSRGDTLAAAAVIGTPGYLSGLSESARQLFLHRYREQGHPEQATRIRALTEAQDILDAGGAAMLSEVHGLFDAVDLQAAEKHAEKVRQAEAG